MSTLPAVKPNAAASARISNESIAGRVAAFETEPGTAEDIAARSSGNRLIVVAEGAQGVVAFASTSP